MRGCKSLIINRIVVAFALAFLLVSAFPTETLASSLPGSDSDTIRIHKSLRISIYLDSPCCCGGGVASGAAAGTASDKGNVEKPADEVYDLKPVIALRSNLLLPLMNVGVQVPLGNRFSIGADWYYPFIRREWPPYQPWGLREKRW